MEIKIKLWRNKSERREETERHEQELVKLMSNFPTRLYQTRKGSFVDWDGNPQPVQDFQKDGCVDCLFYGERGKPYAVQDRTHDYVNLSEAEARSLLGRNLFTGDKVRDFDTLLGLPIKDRIRILLRAASTATDADLWYNYRTVAHGYNAFAIGNIDREKVKRHVDSGLEVFLILTCKKEENEDGI